MLQARFETAVTAQALDTQVEDKQNGLERAAAVAESWLRSQSQLNKLDTQELGLSSLRESLDSDSDSSSTHSSSTGSDSADSKTGKPRQSGRIASPSFTNASKLSQGATAARQETERKERKGKCKRKAKAKQ